MEATGLEFLEDLSSPLIPEASSVLTDQLAGFEPCGRGVLEVTCELRVSGSGTLTLSKPERSPLRMPHDLDD